MIFNNSVNILTQNELIKQHIDEFNSSKERRMMLRGERYYKVENDILNRKMYRYENEQRVEDETKTNNKLAHGFMHLLVDDKVNYLLTKPYTLTCDNEDYLKKVKDVLGKRFQSKLSRLGIETSNKGLGWLHSYIDSKGNFKTMLIPSEEIIPLWQDNDHEELEALIRYYEEEYYEGKEKKYRRKIEYWTAEDVTYYMAQDGDIILDAEMYLDEPEDGPVELGHFKVNDSWESWGKVPFVPFKNNDFELPDLQFVRSLVDNYDTTRSDVANLLEDVKNIIFALKGYGGESLSEFMRDLAYYRAVKLDDDGELDKIETTINTEAAKTHYEALKKDIFDFGQGVDKNSDKLGNSPSGIALKFIYSGLDLKCNSLESWFKLGFEQLIYFVNKYLEITHQGKYDEEIEAVFNRDIQINETEAITNCQNSKGIISDETIIANHPWVEDAKQELDRVKAQEPEQEGSMFDHNHGGDE